MTRINPLKRKILARLLALCVAKGRPRGGRGSRAEEGVISLDSSRLANAAKEEQPRRESESKFLRVRFSIELITSNFPSDLRIAVISRGRGRKRERERDRETEGTRCTACLTSIPRRCQLYSHPDRWSAIRTLIKFEPALPALLLPFFALQMQQVGRART